MARRMLADRADSAYDFVRMQPIHPTIRGRGAGSNPANRFVPIEIEDDLEQVEHDEEYIEGRGRVKSEYLVDSARTIIAYNDSPDVGYSASINPYRGCEHGCIYCYARPTHEYFGLSAGLDFETKIFVKEDAPGLLRRELASGKWVPQTLGFSGVTDPYQPVERRLRLTRRCLEVLLDFRNPVGMVTKSALILRDLDLLKQLAEFKAASACISMTTLDAGLSGKMEPRAASPKRRLEAIAALAGAGLPVGVLVSPVIPGLTDHEMPAILDAAARAGASFAGVIPVRLPGALAGLFEQWLKAHFPERKEKVLNRIRDMRGGKLNDARFHSRMRGEGIYAKHIRDVFRLARRRAGLDGPMPELSVGSFRVPAKRGEQLELFGG